jgi:hypothetical protein
MSAARQDPPGARHRKNWGRSRLPTSDIRGPRRPRRRPDRGRVSHGPIRAALARARIPRRGPAARDQPSARRRRLRGRTRVCCSRRTSQCPARSGAPRGRENDRSTDCASASTGEMRPADSVPAGVHHCAGDGPDRAIVYSLVFARYGSGGVGHAVPVDLDRRCGWAGARVLLRRSDGRPDVGQWIGLGRDPRFRPDMYADGPTLVGTGGDVRGDN